MRGRKPKPRAMKVLAGNPGKRAVGVDPDVPLGVPECPEHLDDVARVEWDRVSGLLADAGLLGDLDRAALAGYCVLYSRWVDAQEKLQKTGLIVKAPSGYPVPNPLIGISNKALKEMRAFLAEFGMTPASRARIDGSKLQSKPKKNPFTELKAG